MGAGGSKVKQKFDIGTDIFTHAIMKNTSSCMNYISISQEEIIRNISGSKIKTGGQYAKITINASCFMGSMQDSAVINKIANDVVTKMKTESDALFDALSNNKNEITTKIRTSVKSITDFQLLAECINKTSISQSRIIEFVDSSELDLGKQEATADLISTCIMNNSQAQKVANEITNTVEAYSEQIQKSPLAVIGEMFGNALQSGYIFLALLVIGFLGFMYFGGADIIKQFV